VTNKKYIEITLPYWFAGEVFCIIVIAGEKYDPEKNIAPAAIVMLNQKFD
jgi:hypothetical protein